MSKSDQARALLERREFHRDEIARLVGLTPGTVSKLASKLGIARLPRPDKLLPDDIEALYAKEGSVRKAARAAGVSPSAVHQALARARKAR